jgi:cell division septation protein DedD
VSKEYTREHGLWTGRQLFLSLTILSILCASFYLMGLYIGRWSSMPSATSNAAVEAPQPAVQQATIQPMVLPPPSEKYSVQIISTETQTEADEVLKRLRLAGFDSAHVIEPKPDSVSQLYIVRVGPYKLEIANQVADELRLEHGFKDVQVMPRQVE